MCERLPAGNYRLEAAAPKEVCFSKQAATLNLLMIGLPRGSLLLCEYTQPEAAAAHTQQVHHEQATAAG